MTRRHRTADHPALRFLVAMLSFLTASCVAAAPYDEDRELAELAEETGMTPAEIEAFVPFLVQSIAAPMAHAQFRGMPLDQKLIVLGALSYHNPASVKQYCDPVWVCGVGCGLAQEQCQRPCDQKHERCMAAADRAEIKCNNDIGYACGVSKACRQRHFAACAEKVQPDRDACDSARTECEKDCGIKTQECKTCCYDSKEGAFDPYGVNLCVQRHFNP